MSRHLTLLALLLSGPGSPGRAQVAADPIPRHESFTLESRAVGDTRRINVYTPPTYAAVQEAFPVVYMPDGGMAEDFPHIANTLDSLIRLGRIRPVVLVGIENTERRRDLTGPTTVASDSAVAPRVGGSAAFRAFLRDELMPEIGRRYRVTDERGLVGESLAGLFVVETLVLEPTLFRHYIAVDPSLWWNGGALVATARIRLAALAGLGRTLYLTAAGERGNGASTERLVEVYRAHAPSGFAWVYEPRPDLQHATIFRATLPGAFARVLR